MIFEKRFLIISVLLFPTLALCQNSFISKLDTLASDFIKSIRRSDKEKIFVQTDKGFYTSGEYIWLKAYCIGTISHKIIQRSKSLFVDLVSEHDSLIGQIMLNNGLFKLNGCIRLPVSLPEGYYWLRAYTRRQIQNDSLSVYFQPLYIFNPSKPNLHKLPNKIEESMSASGDTSNPTGRFYPEGGVLIAGANSRIAFSVIDRQGRPMSASGYVTDSNNSVVAKYSTSTPGLGSFNLFTEATMRYTAHTIYGHGKIMITKLPLPDVNGYQLSVASQNSDSVFVQVTLGDSVYKKNKSSYVLGVCRDSLCFAAVGKDMYAFSIAKKQFPEGKTSLLLFNGEQKIVSQRDIYMGKGGSELTIVTDHLSYGPRQKVKLSVSTNNVDAHQFPLILLVAVTNENIIDKNGGPISFNNIKDNGIVFPSKGYIDSDMNSYSLEQRDLAMLIQPTNYLGWEKSKDSIMESQPREQSDTGVTNLSGRILGKKKQPINKRVITMVLNNGESILETDTTDLSGRFHFRLPDNILDNTKLYFQVSNEKGLQMEDSIVIDYTPFPLFTTPMALKLKFSKFKNKQLAELNHYQLDSFVITKDKGWLQTVIVSKVKKPDVTYDKSKMVSPFSKIIPGDKIGLSPNSIENALIMTPGVTYIPNGVLIRGGGIGGSGPLLFVNDSRVDLVAMHISLFDYLRDLNPRTIDFIEVLDGANATIYGPGSDGGVIYIHTMNKFRPDPTDEKRGLKTFHVQGYSEAPEFIEPDYDKKEVKDSPYPDFRNTIFWNGNILTDKHGKTTIQFFTADKPIKYRILVLGQTKGGEILLGESKISDE